MTDPEAGFGANHEIATAFGLAMTAILIGKI
jgi:hypothetical protein